MGATNTQVKEIAQTILEAVKKIMPELADVAKKTPFEIILTNDDKGIGVEFSIEWDPKREEVVEEEAEVIGSHRIEEANKELVRIALKECKGNRKMAAERLGISERTLSKNIKKYNL